jgi:hypothetical protein
MSDYTPTTEEVRNQYSGFSTSNSNHTGQVYINLAEFDRWLAELICMAKADGFDEGWDARVNAETITPTENPYRQGEEHTHTKRSSFGDPYCKTCGIDLEGEIE